MIARLRNHPSDFRQLVAGGSLCKQFDYMDIEWGALICVAVHFLDALFGAAHKGAVDGINIKHGPKI